MDVYISEQLDKKKKVDKPSSPEGQDGPTPALAIKPVKVD
jgi:hypothetical protein